MLAGDQSDRGPRSPRRAHGANPATNKPGGVGLARATLALDDQHVAGRDRAPRNCAFAAPSIVFGPIAGMSSRRS